MKNKPSFSIPPKLLKLQNRLLSLRQKEKFLLQNGDVGYASAPSNIALIKYWGKSKTEFQLPDNPSISFTLPHFYSKTKITVKGRFFPEGEKPNFIPLHEFYLTDTQQTNTTVSNVPVKLNLFLTQILTPFATDIGLKIESHNNFPTACGMASSASGMAALCFAIANLFNLEKHFSKSELQYWISQWARLGSGSAIRSACLDPNAKFVSWELNSGGSDLKNVDYHKNWNQLKHCMFMLDAHKKEITSSEGHLSAETSPLHNIRVHSVKENFMQFKKAIKDFDFEYVAFATERDAFAMHAVMQTSTPPAIYLNHQVSLVISEFIKFRTKEKLKAFWTLDAGPNIHFLYLESDTKKMMKFHKEMTKKINER